MMMWEAAAGGMATILPGLGAASGLVVTAIRAISMAILGIPVVGWVLALIAALVLLYMKSEGFKKLVDAIAKWIIVRVGSIVKWIVGLFASVWDLFSGSAFGRWLADLFGGIDKALGVSGHRIDLGLRGEQEEAERLRRRARIEAGEEEWSQDEQLVLNMLRDPVTPPLILPPGAGFAAVQAAADSYYSKSMLDQSARNMTLNAPLTIHATTGANADEIASAVGSAVQEAGRNMAEDNDSGRSE